MPEVRETLFQMFGTRQSGLFAGRMLPVIFTMTWIHDETRRRSPK